MKAKYHQLERFFEKIVSVTSVILGNSITFIVVTILISLWLFNIDYEKMLINDIIRDYIYGFSFLTLFMIQKSFNHFSASLHIKLNELVSSHETASNSVLNVETKTEHEIKAIKRDYSDLADQEIENNL